MDYKKMVFKDLNAIPVTKSPKTGSVDFKIVRGDRVQMSISCRIEGRYHGQGMTWAHVVGGSYENMWVPLSFLTALSPGPALLTEDCFSWQWRLAELADRRYVL
jgi:hypothetical protein